MVSLSLLKRWSIRTAAVAALVGYGANSLTAGDSPWPIKQTAGGNTGEIYDTFLVNGATTGVSSGAPCVGQQCLPGGQPTVPHSSTPMAPSTSPIPTEPGAPSPTPDMGANANPPSIQPPNPNPPFNNSQQQNFVDFGQGLGSQTLLASRDVPAMVGDFFGGGLINYSGIGGTFSAPDISNGALGRLKLAENTNPVPTDRFYLNYSFFKNTIMDGVDVNRFTLGAEKTFLNQAMSVEIRLPLISTISQDMFTQFNGIDYSQTSTSDVQVGNLQVYLKGVLWEGEQGLISAGLGLSLPTADDTALLFSSGGAPFLEAKNEAVHMLPFIGGVYTPNERFFASTLMQLDIDLNGQKIFDDGSYVGRLRDQEYLFISQGVGYWMVRDQGLKIAPIAEVHLNQSLSGAESVGPINGRTENLTLVNGVLGVSTIINDEWRATAAYVMPLGIGGADEQFDGEFRFLLNWYFGNRNRTQTQSSFF